MNSHPLVAAARFLQYHGTLPLPSHTYPKIRMTSLDPITAAALERDNRALHKQLDELMARARENDQMLRRFQELELRLIGVNGLGELVENVLFHQRKALDLDAVTLALIDPEYEIRRMLESAEVDPSDYPDLVFLEGEADLARLYGARPAPRLGPFRPDAHGFLFPPSLPLPVNVALLPLVRHGGVIGSLNFGSNSAIRFTPGLATDFLEGMAAVVAMCLENVANQERLKHIGLTDSLTGVHNRRYFEQRLLEETGRSRRQGTPLSCLILDIDHFKRINDTHGHQVGDWVLREAAGRIKAQLRLSDALVRYGGEEFAALLIQTDEATALAIAERIRQAIGDRPFLLSDQDRLSVTLSIGVATSAGGNARAGLEAASENLIARADQALYRAKEEGRNRVVSGSTGGHGDRR